MAGSNSNGKNGKANGRANGGANGRRKSTRVETNTGKPKRVTPELYAAMFEAYMERPSARFVSKECGVDWSTARRVIDVGYPDYAMPPLKDRYRLAMEEANRRAEYTIAEAAAQSLTILRAYKAKVAQRIAKMNPDELPANLGGELDRMIRLESFLLGGPDARPDLTGAGGEGRFEGMTYDQRIAFLRTGRLPTEGLPEADFNNDGEGPGEDGAS